MITPSFGLTATERVLPRLALDFTTASLDSRVTFTRTTSASNPATYVDSSGYVVAATNNQPRFDFNPITLVCNGLLVEESRANLLTYSEDFRNTAAAGSTRPWVYANVSVTADSVNAPSNTQIADTLVEDNTSNVHYINTATLTISNSTAYTFSFFAKNAGRRYVQAVLSSGFGGAGNYATFDLVDGIVSGSSALTASIQNYGNGWYRCIVTATSTNTTFIGYIGLANAATGRLPTYQGDGTSGVYLWGAQLEAGAFATSYIGPTTTAALTRNADVATMTGTNFSDWFNATEGTLYAQGSRFGTSNVFPRLAQCDDGTDNSIINVFVNSSANTGGGSVAVSGATSASYSGFNVGGTNATGKVALAYKQDSFGFAANSTGGTPDTLGNLPTVNSLILGARRSGPAYLNGHIQKIQYWSIRLTQSELNAFTK